MKTAVIVALTVGFISVLAFSAVLILFGHSEELDKLIQLVAPGIGVLINLYVINRVRKTSEADLEQTKRTRRVAEEILENGIGSGSTTSRVGE